METLDQELLPYKHDLDLFVCEIKKLWPEWDYHNFPEHATESMWEFLGLVNDARANGVEIPTEDVVAGLLSTAEHDLANHWGTPVLTDHFEERSGNIGSGWATRIGIPGSIIKKKMEATLATRPGSECKSLLDVMVRRADIANLGWDYDRFKEKTIKYWREMQLQSEEPKSFSHWVRSDIVVKKIMLLLGQDLSLGDFDRGESGLSIFQEDVFANFQTLDDDLNSPDFIEPELFPQAS